MHARERRAAAAVHPPRHLRPLRLVPRLPAARPLQHQRPREVRAAPAGAAGRASPSSSTSASASPRLARVHFVVHLPKGEAMPDVDIHDLERRLAEASRSWHDDFTAAVIAEYGEETGATLSRRYLDSFPEAYKEDFAPRTAAVDLGRLEAIEGDEGIDHSLYQRPRRRRAARPGSRSSGSARRCRSRRCCRRCRRWASRSSTSGPTCSTAWPRPSHIYDFGLRYDGSAAGERAGALPGRVPGGLGRPQRDRRVQRAGARRRA